MARTIHHRHQARCQHLSRIGDMRGGAVGLLVLKRPCSCGSGRAARGCCGLLSHVSQRDAAVAYLARQARHARDLIGPFSPAAMTTLRAEAATLPARCGVFTDSLLVAREPVGSDVRKVARALERSRSGQLGSRHVLAALESADSPMARVAVAKALITMREAGVIDEYLPAAAFLELATATSPIAEAALLAAGRSIAGLDLPTAEVPAVGGEDRRPVRAAGRARMLAGRAGPATRHGLADGRA
jgi:hypothetical protein